MFIMNVGRSMIASATSACRGVRRIGTSSVRRGGGGDHDDHHDIGGVPGANLPFDIGNRHKLAIYMGLWFGSGFAVPFLLLRHQLKKKNQA